MAEPLAIIGAVKSIAGIIDILGKSISTIRELRRQWKDADFNVLNISTQLTALRAALAKIKEWGESYLGVPHHQLIIDLDDSVACCGTIVEKIDAWLSELQKKPNRKLEVSGKIKSLIGSKSIDDLQRTLELQTNALTLLLTVCNWYELELITLTKYTSPNPYAARQVRSRKRFLRGAALARLLHVLRLIPRRWSFIETQLHC